MSIRQKKSVTFKDDKIKKPEEPEFDFNINYLILKYKSLILNSKKEIIYILSDIQKHEAEYNLDVSILYNKIREHNAYIESKVAEMEYHIAIRLERKNDKRVDKKTEKNKLIIENENKHFEFHKIKINVQIADCYASLIYHKFKSYTKIVGMLNDLHNQMNNEYKDLQKLFDNSKCTEREEWQEYIKPFIDQLFEFHNIKENYEGLLNGVTLDKEKSNEYYFKYMKELNEYKW